MYKTLLIILFCGVLFIAGFWAGRIRSAEPVQSKPAPVVLLKTYTLYAGTGKGVQYGTPVILEFRSDGTVTWKEDETAPHYGVGR